MTTDRDGDETGFGDDTIPARGSGPGHGKLGPYRLLRELGSGGMGTVYLAEQREPVRRHVAVKVVKPGLDTNMVLSRFVAERQALARMSHPGIAQVYDAGTTPAGRSYFVMEYVPGEALTDYCDRVRLDTSRRLALFRQVCRAVHHAHQKGVIHRDLKPSNILVCVIDGMPQPKVIDFGVAKATAGELTNRTLFTEQGQLLGTPEYMSPEQADLTGLRVDTASDVYSLGVILYELLTGELPVDRQSLREAGLAGIQKLLQSVEPAKPSTRITTIDSSRAQEIARRRRIDPKYWSRMLRGELDWITLKALAKEPERRYASASEFAADLERYDQGEAVLAGAPGTIYRVRKFVGANRAFFTGLAAVVMALSLGLAGVLLMYGESEAARRDARWRSYVANIRYANSAADAHELTEARRALQECPEEFRHWEWNYLTGRVDRSEAIWATMDQDIGATAMDPKGEWIVVGLDDGRVRTISPGRKIDRYLAPATAERVTSLALDPKADRLAGFARGDSSLFVWNLSTGELVAEFPSPQDEVTKLLYSGDGTMILVLGAGVVAIDAVTGEHRATVLTTEDRDQVNSFHPLNDGRRAVVRTMFNGPDIVDLETGEALTNCKPDIEGITTVLAVDTSRNRVACITSLRGPSHDSIKRSASTPAPRIRIGSGPWRGFAITVHDVDTGEVISVLKPGDNNAFCAVFTPDGRHLVTGHHDNTVRIWDISGGFLLMKLEGHTDFVKGIGFDEMRNRIVTWSADRTVRVWNLEEIRSRALARESWASWVRDLAMSPDGRRLAVAKLDYLEVFDLDSGALVASVEPPDSGHVFIAAEFFSPDSLRAVSAASIVAFGKMEILQFFTDNRVHPVAMTSIGLGRGAPSVRHLGEATCRIRAAALDPLHNRVAIATDRAGDGNEDSCPGSQRLAVFDADDGRQILAVGEDGFQVFDVSFGPEGRTLVAGCDDGTVRIWDLAAGQLINEFRSHETSIVSIALAGNDGSFVAGSADRRARIWDLDGRRSGAVLKGHDDAILDSIMNPDGSRLFTIGADGTVRVWDPVSSNLLLTLRYGDNSLSVSSLALSPDGHKLYVPSTDVVSVLDGGRN